MLMFLAYVSRHDLLCTNISLISFRAIMVGISSHSPIFAVQNLFLPTKSLSKTQRYCALHCIAGVFLHILAFLITHLCSFRCPRKEPSSFGGHSLLLRWLCRLDPTNRDRGESGVVVAAHQCINASCLDNHMTIVIIVHAPFLTSTIDDDARTATESMYDFLPFLNHTCAVLCILVA